MIKSFSKLFNVELKVATGNQHRQVLFINRGEVVEIITSSMDDHIISTVAPNNRMDDTSSFFDSVTEDTAINIAGFWGCMTVPQIKEYIEKSQEDLHIPINPIEVH